MRYLVVPQSNYPLYLVPSPLPVFARNYHPDDRCVEVQPREIQNYLAADGTRPFVEWLDSLRDTRAVDKVEKRLKRVACGNLGDYRFVGEGVCELKIDYGPGYRVYFGQIGSKIVLLLCGGDKSSQEQDIHRAKEYWKDYERRESANK